MAHEVAGDLHLHTTASDGTDTLANRVSQAKEAGLAAFAVTDHDRISDDLGDRRLHREGVEVVTGVEARADIQDTKVEILGYYVDPAAESLGEILTDARRYRRARNREMVERLSDATGESYSYEGLRSEADGQLGRPHVAGALVERGVVDSVGEAFDEHLAPGGSSYVPMKRPHYERVLDAIHDAGGVASLAHPGRIRSDEAEVFVRKLCEAGLDAIEVWYPYGRSGPTRHSPIGVEEADSLAAELDILRTGGSDCHGQDSGKYRIGNTGVGTADLDALRDAANRRRPLD
ncbi:MAG TPA: PHP domain-containing protein [Halobacteriales archaeon]|nr:PHP domain-containing protein [Halobacteriales archaeon]